MSDNKIIIEEIKKHINAAKIWKNLNQKNYLLNHLQPFFDPMKTFSFEEKKEVLYHCMVLSKKSYINLIAKAMDLNLNDDKIVMWIHLSRCADRQYCLEILDKKENWNDFFDDKYFFHQVFLKGQDFYVDKHEKDFCKKMLDIVASKTDAAFWLSKEKTTGLSKLSYIMTQHEPWGDFCRKLVNIKPNWLRQGAYNIINKNNQHVEHEIFTLDEEKIDWVNHEQYNEQAVSAVRKVLDNLWMQKMPNGQFIFENERIKPMTLASMWLFSEKHFQLNIFTTEEKSRLIEKLLNDNSAFINIKSKSEEGRFMARVLQDCFSDKQIKWHQLNLSASAWHALNTGNYESVVKNCILKSKLEEDLTYENQNIKKSKL